MTTTRETTATRLLLPVAASLVLVAVLIANGIRVNRAQLEAYADSQRQAIASMRRLQVEAIDYLRVRQNGDGSWTSDAATDGAVPSDPKVDVTLRILLNVRRAGYAEEPLFAAGLRFARSQEDRVKRSPLGRLLLPHPAAGAMTPVPRSARLPTPPPAPAALGTEVLRLGALPPDGEEASRLLASIRSRLRRSPPPAAAWLTLGYLGTLAAESGSPAARALLPELLEGFRARVGPDPWSGLDNLALASYVELVGRGCRARNDPCQEGNRALQVLVERRRIDGSWAAGELGLDDGRRGRSDPETTSAALAAIAVFEEVLAHRFGF